ncbi:voltage-gated calcium channel protein, putative, partial [Bodo saltans]
MSLLELVQLPSPSNSNCGNQPDGYELSAIANTGVMVEDHAGTSEDEAMDFTGFHLTRHEIAALDAPTSLFILSGDNILRLRMLQVIRSRIFQNIVLGCIILNSLLLGADWPSYINPPAFATFLQVADLFFTAVFTLEIVVKVIA